MNLSTELSLAELTPEVIAQIDLRVAGQIVRGRAIHLSHKVNEELMQPISHWLDDPDWMTRFTVYDGELPNWAVYKQKQREWDEYQKQEQAIKMRLYWSEVTRLRNMRSEVSKMLAESRLSNDIDIQPTDTPCADNPCSEDYISPLLESYSPIAEHKRNIRQEFIQSLSQSISNLLPWRTILLSEISESLNRSQSDSLSLSSLQIYYEEDKKKDIASKLMHLLQLDKDGDITISQSEPFGEISVSIPSLAGIDSIKTNTNINTYIENKNPPDSYSNTHNPVEECRYAFQTNRFLSLEGSELSNKHLIDYPSDINIQDTDGNTYLFDWKQLSNAQRNKVIADIKSNKILCKAI